jgi:hypothetical protein
MRTGHWIAQAICAVAAAGAATITAPCEAERQVEAKVDEIAAAPLWLQSIHTQALREIEDVCGSKLTTSAANDSGTAFRRIVQGLLGASGRDRIEVLFAECPAPMTAVNLGATIVASGAWLSRAAERDLWAVAAHELAHRTDDFARRFVIEYHLPGFRYDDKTRLCFDIELRADRRAMELLRAAGRPAETLAHALKQELARNPSPELRRRIAAIESASKRYGRAPSLDTAGCERPQ